VTILLSTGLERNRRLKKRLAAALSRRFHPVSKAFTELFAPATDRLVGHDHPTLEEQFLDVTQAQLEAEIPAYGATDDLGWTTVTVIQRFRFLHRGILRLRPNNQTMPGQCVQRAVIDEPTAERSVTRASEVLKTKPSETGP
jgi:hypothetical protein